MKSKPIDKSKEATVKLTVSAIMVALSTVLSIIPTPISLPYGGSVTIFSFVPILFVGYAYGVAWGVGAGVVHGIIQMIIGISGAVAETGFKWWQVVLCALLDYIIAFGMLGLAGTFKKSIKNPQASFAVGTLFACVLKYASHFLSGYILFRGYAEWFFTQDSVKAIGSKILSTYGGNVLGIIYSLFYNATFSVPETILSLVMVVVLISVKPIRKAAGIK